MPDRSQVDPPPEYWGDDIEEDEECEADYWWQMNKDEPPSKFEQEKADWEAVNQMERERDERNER